MKVAIIKPDRTITETTLDFEGCQKAVGGYVELLNLAPGVCAYVNEDGIAMNLPENELATLFCRRLGPNISVVDYIKGVMVVTGASGNRGVTAKTVKMIKKLATEV